MKTIRAQDDQHDSKRSSSHPRPLSWRKKNTKLRAFLANDASHGSAWTIHCVRTVGGHLRFVLITMQTASKAKLVGRGKYPQPCRLI